MSQEERQVVTHLTVALTESRACTAHDAAQIAESISGTILRAITTSAEYAYHVRDSVAAATWEGVRSLGRTE